MSSISDIGKKIGDFTEGVVNKAGDKAESVKISYELTKLNEQIKASFAELGRLYYQKTPKEELEPIITDIDEQMKVRAGYEETLRGLRKLVLCECGSECPATKAFCSDCGAKLSQ